jgi:hypothetical protein
MEWSGGRAVRQSSAKAPTAVQICSRPQAVALYCKSDTGIFFDHLSAEYLHPDLIIREFSHVPDFFCDRSPPGAGQCFALFWMPQIWLWSTVSGDRA